MQEQIRGAAWGLGLWGVLSIIFGVMVLAWPGISLKAFLIVLGVYLLASGVVMTVGSLVRHTGHWIGGAVVGILTAIAGLYVFSHPEISALAVLAVIAIWSIAIGSILFVSGFETGNHRWWLSFSGLVWVAFGFYIFARPGDGALTLMWLIGLSAIFAGVMSSVAAFRLTNFEKKLSKA